MSLHTRHTCQRAFAKLLEAASVHIGESGPALRLSDFPARFPDPVTGGERTAPVGVQIACGQLAEDGSLPAEWTALKLPAVVVNCINSEPHAVGYEICDVTIFAITTMEEIEAPAAVDARAGFLEALFTEELLPAIAADLGDPAAAVQPFFCIGIERNGTAHQQRDNFVMSGLHLRVSCCA